MHIPSCMTGLELVSTRMQRNLSQQGCAENCLLVTYKFKRALQKLRHDQILHNWKETLHCTLCAVATAALSVTQT